MSNDVNTLDVDANLESDTEASERRHSRMLACMSGVAAGLLVATVLFFAIYDRAELQFLFAKPTAPAANSAPVMAKAAPDNTVAANR